MRRFRQIVRIAFVATAALTLMSFGRFAVIFAAICVNEETLPRRTAQWDADLRAKVPPGSRPEQVCEWLNASGFGPGDPHALDRYAAEPPQQSVWMWRRDPVWWGTAHVWIEMKFDEQGRVQSTQVTSTVISL